MIAYTDPLGTSNPRIKVQVKRQPDTKIDAHGLRAFIGTLGTNANRNANPLCESSDRSRRAAS
jgi:hypothetical protein